TYSRHRDTSAISGSAPDLSAVAGPRNRRSGAAFSGTGVSAPSAVVHVNTAKQTGQTIAFAACRRGNPTLIRPGLSGGGGGDHRGLSWTRRFSNQRSVPHAERLTALLEQYRALS